MKKILLFFATLYYVGACFAQEDVTKFLGIPIDGTKREMISKLKDKGFKFNPSDELFKGEFNGREVNVHVVTNGNKVYRIVVCDANTCDETSIRIRFNELCRQFEKNPKYLSIKDYTIPDDEDISYEMTVRDKRYEACFYQTYSQVSEELRDSIELRVMPILKNRFTAEELSNPTQEIKEEIVWMSLPYVLDKIDQCSKKVVWFMISELFVGKYYITMFYDNEYNRADGEDL